MRIIVAFLINTLVNFAIGLLVATFLGPDQFGRFALAIGVGGLLQVLLFDWIRLATARFYSETIRTARPDVRATHDRAFWWLAGGLAITGLVALGCADADGALPGAFIAGALAFAATNGYFDYQAALLRARFEDRAYGRLVLTKNILALGLTAGTAYATGSALATLAGASLGLVGAVLALRIVTRDMSAPMRLASPKVLRESLAYGVPLCISNVLFLLIPLGNRALATGLFGFAETGQLALAQDVGLRLVLAIGTALDVLLFQFAVRADEAQGSRVAHAQVARNMAVIFAITLPAIAGIWLVLPSFEALIVPAAFRGTFAHYFTLLLPGLFCFGLMTFGLAPAFQIARRTWPVSVAAGIGCLVDVALLTFGATGSDAALLASAQAAAMVAGFATLLVLSPVAAAHWPRARDILGATVGTAVMAAATFPLRALDPGVTTALLQVLAGGMVYGVFVFALDLAGLRGHIFAALARLRTTD